MDYKDNDDKGGKHICAICGDILDDDYDYKQTDSREGRQGFFKRTLRKDLTYSCRDYKYRESYHKCQDLCQYCRYQRALAKGTKREAVQEEVGIHHQHHHGGSMGMSGSGTGY
nr:artificial RNA-ligase [synthetic construct]